MAAGMSTADEPRSRELVGLTTSLDQASPMLPLPVPFIQSGQVATFLPLEWPESGLPAESPIPTCAFSVATSRFPVGPRRSTLASIGRGVYPATTCHCITMHPSSPSV